MGAESAPVRSFYPRIRIASATSLAVVLLACVWFWHLHEKVSSGERPTSDLSILRPIADTAEAQAEREREVRLYLRPRDGVLVLPGESNLSALRVHLSAPSMSSIRMDDEFLATLLTPTAADGLTFAVGSRVKIMVAKVTDGGLSLTVTGVTTPSGKSYPVSSETKNVAIGRKGTDVEFSAWIPAGTARN